MSTEISRLMRQKDVMAETYIENSFVFHLYEM